MKIAIVVPVYNEEKRAVNTVNDILKVDKVLKLFWWMTVLTIILIKS